MAAPMKEVMSNYKPGSVSATLFGKQKGTGASKTFLTELFSSPTSHDAVKKNVKLKVSPKKPLSQINHNDTTKKGPNKSSPKTKKVFKPSHGHGEEVVQIDVKQKSKKKVNKKKQDGGVKIPVNDDTHQQSPRLQAGDKEKSVDHTGGASDFPFQHESLSKSISSKAPAKSKKRRIEETTSKDEEESPTKRLRKHRHRDKTDDKRTIFIGNCSLSTDKKALKRLFKQFGPIESVRFRCAPAAQLELPRRAVVITKNFHEQSKSFVSFIVFKEEEDAAEALSMNGHLLDGLHLRVDLASQSKKHDKKQSIFLGNLPFDAKEEDLRAHFEDCGDIMNVRVIRDRRTSLGKGIAYVQFDSKDSVNLALKLDKSDFRGRPVRVRVCTNNPEKIEERKARKEAKTSQPKPEVQEKKLSFAPSNRTSSSFQSLLKLKKEKRLRKIKKKKGNAKKSDGLSAIFGDVEPKKKQLKFKGKKDKHNKKDTKGKKREKGSSSTSSSKGSQRKVSNKSLSHSKSRNH